jgi:hypothetical protein
VPGTGHNTGQDNLTSVTGLFRAGPGGSSQPLAWKMALGSRRRERS